ncbi:FAD-dependent oxidoreductase, partial [Chloroflexota bacterium]
SGVEVTLVEESPALHVNSPGEGSPLNLDASLRFMPRLLKASRHNNINIITGAGVSQVKGERGDFKVTVVRQPRYVNTDLCTSCGRCERECPVDVVPCPAGAHKEHKAIHRPDFGLKSVPSAYTVEKKGIPPCTAACPAGVNVQGYVALTSQGKFDAALNLVAEAVPFPRVLGRVCTHPCESMCTRAKVDQAVSICALKRFVADNATDYLLRQAQASNNTLPLDGSSRIAIIGAGAAGLTAARDLTRLGHHSTVFEALPVPGGMISVGMPRFRLPREVRQADIEDIVRLGIEIRTSTPIGRELTIQDLQRQGYKSILIATGAHRNQRLNIPGENLTGVINSIALLRALNLREPITVGHKVAVIGGGYTAIDSARTAIRLHCEKVLVLYRRSLEEMPANPEEVVEAQEEGVEIEYLAAPVRIIGQAGKVVGVECIRMRLGETDKSGRRRPIPIEGSEFVVAADTVIVAVGQRADLSFLNGDATLTEGTRHIVIDPVTMATRVHGIFAVGDVSRAPGTLISAIADGRRAANSIDRFLRGESLRQGRFRDKVVPVEVNLEEIYIPPVERQEMPLLPHADRVGNFEQVDLGFTTEAAVKEAERCLNCAVCSECLECQRACELKAIDHKLTTERFELAVDAVITAGGTGTQQFTTQPGDDRGESVLPAMTPRPGVYLIATLASDGDLSQASAVATKVLVDLARYNPISNDGHKSRRETSKTGSTEVVSGSQSGQQAPGNPEPRVGVFVCGCGGSISEVVNLPDVVEYCSELGGVVVSREIGYACIDEAAREIRGVARQRNLTHVVLAACSCCNQDQICFSCSDRRVQCKSNLLYGSQLGGIGYEFINIREHCAWVHHNQPERATSKAKALIRAGVARAVESQPLAKRALIVERSVLVVGGGLSGMQAAADLVAQDFQTILIREHKLDGGHSEEFDSVRRNLESGLGGSRIMMLSGAELVDVDGTAGRYQATVVRDGTPSTFTVGAIILDLSAINGQESNPSAGEMALPPLLLKAFRNDRQEGGLPFVEPAVSRLPGVFLCGIGKGAADVAGALVQGSAAAGKALALLNRGTIDVEQTVVAIDRQRCRGCGTCVSVCPFGAISLIERNPGVFLAQLSEGLCRGCGICGAHCPSGALSQSGYSDRQLTASLEAILSS